MYEIKYTDLRGNIINESKALEEGNYYKSYYYDDIVVKEEIAKNDLCECIRQHMDKYSDISICFHMGLLYNYQAVVS